MGRANLRTRARSRPHEPSDWGGNFSFLESFLSHNFLFKESFLKKVLKKVSLKL